MKTEQNRFSNRRGGILIIVMVIVVTMTLMVTAVLGLSKFNAFETEKQLRQTQARWMAEAGLEQIKAMIKADKSYRNGIDTGSGFTNVGYEFTGYISDTNKYYEVFACKQDISGTEETIFYIQSDGMVNSTAFGVQTNSVRAKLTTAPGVDQGLMSLGGDSYIKQSRSTHINSDIYIAGEGDVNVLVNGNVEDADDGMQVDYGGGTDLVDEMDFLPFDQTDYTNWIHTANTDTNAHQATSTPYTGLFDLSTADDGIIYVHGDIDIENDVTVTGLTIVATGNVNFNTPNKQLAANTRIVAGGNIDLDKSGITFGVNTELFSRQDITIGGNETFPASGMTILAMDDVVVEANVTLNGIIYAEGSVNLVNGTQNITGTIIAWDGFDILSNTTITYDPGVFAEDNPLESFFTTVVQTKPSQWAESPF
jgi:hypothetical protein